MNKFKIIPLAFALSTIGLLTGCFDKKDEVKPEVNTQTQAINSEVKPEQESNATQINDNKSENNPVSSTVNNTADNKVDINSTTQVNSTQNIAQENNSNTAIAVNPEELPVDFFAPLVAGKDYLKVAIDPTKNLVEASYDKPVIVDFFWYGCGHCNAMRPFMDSIIKSNPNILAVKYPAAFPNWESGTKLYFAYKQMNLLEQLHDETFVALHVDRKNILGNNEQLEKFLKEKNVDLDKFKSIQSSFQMSRDLLKAKEVSTQYKLESTPNMGVYYKGYAYLVNPSISKGYENTAQSVKTILSKFTPEQIAGKK